MSLIIIDSNKVEKFIEESNKQLIKNKKMLEDCKESSRIFIDDFKLNIFGKGV